MVTIENVHACEHIDEELFEHDDIDYARCINCRSVRKIIVKENKYNYIKPYPACKKCRKNHKKGESC